MTDNEYCPTCNEKVAVVQTVGWQPNVCGRCGNDLED